VAELVGLRIEGTARFARALSCLFFSSSALYDLDAFFGAPEILARKEVTR